MRKFILFCMIFMLVFTSACSPKKEKKSEDFLYDKGLEMTGVMEEAALSQVFIDAVLATEDNLYFSKVSEVDLRKPSKAFEIELSKELLNNQFPENITEDISKAFERSLDIKSKESLALKINARSGAEAIVFSSLTAIKDAFSYPDLKEDVIFLYIYEEGFSVMVVYSVYDDAVSAISYFLVDESLKTIKSVETLEAWFQEILNIKDIKIRKLH